MFRQKPSATKRPLTDSHARRRHGSVSDNPAQLPLLFVGEDARFVDNVLVGDLEVALQLRIGGAL
jgi:hypothetical protein